MTYLSTDPGTLATKADIDRRFEGVDQRFEAIDRRFEEVDRRFDAVDRRFERVENAFADLNRRLDRLFLAVVTALLAMIATVWTQIVLG